MTVHVNRYTAPIALRIEFDARPGMFNLSHTCTAPFRALIYAALGFDLGLYAFICFSTPAVRAGGARPAPRGAAPAAVGPHGTDSHRPTWVDSQLACPHTAVESGRDR